MIDRDAIHGGFNNSLRSQMSPQLQRRIAEQEAAEAREVAAEQRERAQRAEAWQQNAITAAIQDAVAAGAEFSPKMLAGRGIGSTHAEFLQQRAALMDREDAQIQARQAVAYRKWLQEQNDGMSGDTSAHIVEAERAERQKQETRRREARLSSAVRKHVKRQTVEEARKAAFGDTTRAIYAVERMRGSR